MAQQITLEVIKKEQKTEYIYFVTFRLVNPPTFDFRAGQNMMLMIATGINRTMSIASPPTSNNELLMIHDVGPMGPGSKWTLGLKVGDKVTIVAPTGGALSLLDTLRKKIMVATGTGIAPFRAMVLDYLSSSSLISHTASLMLYWGLRFEKDRYLSDEFDALAKEHANFSWHQVISQPTPAWQGLTGHVTEHVLALENLLENEYYLCGNKHMIEDMMAKLLAQHVPKEQIKTELFY
jgi:NAD(P)H-flavin reductase